MIAANIIVACGGSGSKTVKQIVDLMSQDPSWRYEMTRSMYVMLVDTDEGDLKKNSAAIKKMAPGIDVSEIWVTEGFNSAGEILADYFENMTMLPQDERKQAIERFAQHWWCKNPSADDIASLGAERLIDFAAGEKGAGQVPMFSYLATWRNMGRARTKKSVEAGIENLVRTVSNRRANLDGQGRNPGDAFNVFLIGSVAGGTGRGCSQLIAFKLKEVFARKMGAVPLISGYFFDSSVFTSMAGNDSVEERHAQRMNAATGWSEYSMWLPALKAGKRLEYSLPSMINTHDAASDVLNTRPGSYIESIEKERKQVPFDAMAVICNRSEVIEIRQPTDLYKMLATALYVRLSQSAIDSSVCNKTRTILSVGSSRIQINFSDIDQYFKARAEHETKNRLLKHDEASARAASEVLLKRLGMLTPVQSVAPSFDEQRSDTKEPLDFFRQSVRKNGLFVNRINTALTLLDEQDTEGLEVEVDKLLSSAFRDSSDVKTSVQTLYADALMAQSETSSLEEWLKEVRVEFLEHAFGSHASLRGLSAACDLAVKAIRRAFRELDESIDLLAKSPTRPAGRLPLPNLQITLQEISKKDGFLGFGKPFSDEEKERFEQEIRVFIHYLAGKILGGSYLQANSPVQKVLVMLEGLKARCDELISDVEEYYTLKEAKPLQEWEAKLFCRADERNPHLFDLEQALSVQNPDDPSFNIEREILPLMPSSEEIQVKDGSIRGVLRNVLDGQGDDKSSFKRIGQIRDALSDVSVALVDPDSGRARSVAEYFALESVIRRLEPAWCKFLLQAEAEGADRWNLLRQKFYKFFGIEPRIIRSESGERQVVLADQDLEGIAGENYLLLAMAGAAARTCRPFWRAENALAARFTVVVPMALTNTAGWEDYISRTSNVADGGDNRITTVIANDRPMSGTNADTSVNKRNPYILAVYVSDGVSRFDDITSLEDWEHDPIMRRSLQHAEDAGELMPFQGEANFWPGYRGSGFTSPIFVTNPAYRVFRWRPWISEADRKAELDGFISASETSPEEAFALPLLYAIFGPMKLLEWAFGHEGAVKAASAVGLESISADPMDVGSYALLKEESAKRIVLQRRPVEFGANGQVADSDVFVTVGFALCQRVTRLMSVLSGEESALAGGSTAASQVSQIHIGMKEEYTSFMTNAGDKLGFNVATGIRAHQAMIEGMRSECRRIRDELGQGDEDSQFWHQMYLNLG